MKKILVAASTSVNKMKGVAATVKSMCELRGVSVETVAENVFEVDLDKVKPDVIVLLGINALKTDIPVVLGVPFLTKIGMDKTIDEIIQALK